MKRALASRLASGVCAVRVYFLASFVLGPGTLWEQWDGDEFHPGGDPTRGGQVSSKNHHMFSGGVGLFMYEAVAGSSTTRLGLCKRALLNVEGCTLSPR